MGLRDWRTASQVHPRPSLPGRCRRYSTDVYSENSGVVSAIMIIVWILLFGYRANHLIFFYFWNSVSVIPEVPGCEKKARSRKLSTDVVTRRNFNKTRYSCSSLIHSCFFVRCHFDFRTCLSIAMHHDRSSLPSPRNHQSPCSCNEKPAYSQQPRFPRPNMHKSSKPPWLT